MNDIPAFPTFFRPQVGYSYRHSGQNLVRTPIAGGSSRATVNYCQEKVEFNLSFVIESHGLMQVFNDWYFNIVEQGTKKFTMDLNATGIKEQHVCIIVPGSINVSGNKPFSISLTIEAEKVFSPFNGDLYYLAEAGYSNISAYFERIEQFANYDIK